MSISIGAGSSIDAGASGAAAALTTSLQAQVAASQSAIVTALFGSLGIGTNTNAAA